MPWMRFLIRRGLLGIATLWVVSLLIFFATQALPGDAAYAALGRDATPQRLAYTRAQLHLDLPVTSQYGRWLGGVLTGQLGTSFSSGLPVGELIGNSVVNSSFLMLCAGLVGIPLALVLGVVTAVRRDSVTDQVSAVLTLALAALPEFVVAIGLVLLISTGAFHLLPATSSIVGSERPWEHINLVILPAASLALLVIPYVARMIRASMVEVLESEYVIVARLKGLPEWRVVWIHALVNAIAPTLQAIAIALAYLVGGVVIVETVFGYPGMGSLFVQAIDSRDIPVVQALTLFIAAFYVTVNIAADFATIAVTPRLRSSLR
jgi:peptide/nickel transport system permease protein